MTFRIQITLTVAEGKKLIARAVSLMPQVKRALEAGRILLKGGTTVSSVSEELTGMPLRISGRITPLGTKSARGRSAAPHTVLVEKGVTRGLDETEDLIEAVKSMRAGDVAVIGANLVDLHGNAAIMAGSELGGPPGQILSGLMAQGVEVIIVAGLEKIAPVDIKKALEAAGRTKIMRSMGMAVGLMPIFGRLITEVEALMILGALLGEQPEVTVVGRGGIGGAEGGVTLVVSGNTPGMLEGLWKEALRIKGAVHSGESSSLFECAGQNPWCDRHLGCVYGGKAGKYD